LNVNCEEIFHLFFFQILLFQITNNFTKQLAYYMNSAIYIA